MKLFCSKCEKPFPADGNSPAKCPDCGSEVIPPEKFPGPGAVIGDFLIEKLISRGGMGEVFVARQISLDRPVALKVLQGEYTHDREYVDSLFREARAAAKINHPNIVQAYAVGEDDGVFYFAMELVRGDTMKAVLKRDGIIPFVQAARVIRDIARALDVAWREQKLVHQDIKPDNIMLDNTSGFAKLADLGLAKTGGIETPEDDSDEVFGTPQYISPEQLTGVPTDVRSDIYSLGATFFQFVTGRFPYVASSAEELARMHDAGKLEPPKSVNPQVPEALNRIILKMMARKLEDRYQTPEPLIEDLEAYLRRAEREPEVPVRAPAAPKAPETMPKLAVPRGGKKASVPQLKTPATPATASPPPSPAVPSQIVPPPVPAADLSGGRSVPGEAGEGRRFSLPWLKIFKIVGCVVIGGAALVGISAGGLYILGYYDKLPAALKPFAHRVFPKLGKVAAASPAPVAPKDAAVSTEPTRSSAETAPPAAPPAVRAEYQRAADRILNGDFRLEFVDADWKLLCAPASREETSLLAAVIRRFAVADEVSRCAPEREEMRSRYRRALEAEMRARLAAQSERERLRRESERRQQEIERVRREEEARQKEHLANLKARIAEHTLACFRTMLAAIQEGRQAEFDEALRQAKLYRDSLFGASAGEVQLKREFSAVLDAMPREVARMRGEFARLTAITPKQNLVFRVKGRRMTVVSIRPGEVICRNDADRDEKIAVDALDSKSKDAFFRAVKVSEFDFAMFNRRTPEARTAPSQFWKDCLELQK